MMIFVIGSVLFSFVAETLPWFGIGLSGTDVPGTAFAIGFKQSKYEFTCMHDLRCTKHQCS